MQREFQTREQLLFGATIRTSAPTSDLADSLSFISRQTLTGPIAVISRYDVYISFALERPILSPYPDITTNLNEYEDVLKIVGFYRKAKPKMIALESKLLENRFDEAIFSLEGDGKEGDLLGLGRGKDLGTSMSVTWHTRSRMAFLITQLKEQMLSAYRPCHKDAFFQYYCASGFVPR